MIEIIEAEYVTDYILKLKFNDGNSGTIDLEEHIYGPAFKPLKDLEFFKKVEVTKDLGTITWPNEVDFAPEFLLEHII